MAQWKETLEPYIKVQERIRNAATVPVAGEDLIVGAVIISDAGPATATLITGQKEFLSTYASKDLTESYMKDIDKLYKGDDDSLASTIWLNAYRLSGSTSMLVVRAAKANDIYFAKALTKGDHGDYIVRDGQLLKKVQEFKLVIDTDKDSAIHSSDGWSIAVNGIGVIGNRTTDEGAQYDYYVQTLPDLVDYLNDTPSFFSPDYTYYSNVQISDNSRLVLDDNRSNANQAACVVFHEVYMAADFLDVADTRTANGLSYIVTCQKDWTLENANQKLVDLSGEEGGLTNFTAPKYAALNKYNTSSDLKVRIRRFNHDAVVSKEVSKKDANANGVSPYTVLTSVLDTFTANGTKEVSEANAYRDFYEVSVFDPSISSEPEYFNVGNIAGRGDMTAADLNKSLGMIQLQLPDNMAELNLDYYGYVPASKRSGWKALTPAETEELTSNQIANAESFATVDSMEEMGTKVNGTFAVVGRKVSDIYKWDADADNELGGTGAWVLATEEEKNSQISISYQADSLDRLKEIVKRPQAGDFAKVGVDATGTFYKYATLSDSEISTEELAVDLSIDPTKLAILNVTPSDLKKALDSIELNEIYTVEGLADLGCTAPGFQSYMANIAVNSNYFYPISTVNSTNYLAIANSFKSISSDSYKLYASAPWDVDSGTTGFKFYASPDVLYWETVSRNRKMNREFADTFGQTTGVIQYQNPVVEFNKKTRQLLLTKKINTVLWNTQTSAWNMNESVTKQSEDNIMGNDGNVRLQIRISKAIPILLRQFIGRKISEKLWKDAESVIDSWFKNTLGPLEYGVDGYLITINAENNPVEIQRQNKMRVLVEVKFARALKYIEVFNDALDMGMDFTATI